MISACFIKDKNEENNMFLEFCCIELILNCKLRIAVVNLYRYPVKDMLYFADLLSRLVPSRNRSAPPGRAKVIICSLNKVLWAHLPFTRQKRLPPLFIKCVYCTPLYNISGHLRYIPGAECIYNRPWCKNRNYLIFW